MGDSSTLSTLEVACSNGLKGVVVALAGDLQKRFGELTINYGSTKQLGDTASPATDVVIMSETAIDALIAAGTLAEGRFDLVLDGREFVATTGDLIRLPMQIPHGIFNKSDQAVKCLFWVSPTRKLYDLFWAIHSMKEQVPEEVVVLSAKHEVEFLPPPE